MIDGSALSCLDLLKTVGTFLDVLPSIYFKSVVGICCGDLSYSTSIYNLLCILLEAYVSWYHRNVHHHQILPKTLLPLLIKISGVIQYKTSNGIDLFNTPHAI